METAGEQVHSKLSGNPWFFRLIKGAAILHLGLTICGAVRLNPISLNPGVGGVIAHYQAYSGSGNGYGFFAPGVASPQRVLLHGYRADKGEWVTMAETGTSREAELRLSTTTGLFSQPNYHEFVAASWAAWMFGNDPDASLAIVEIQVFTIPMMSEFRAGEKPQWQVIKGFPFARRRDDKGGP